MDNLKIGDKVRFKTLEEMKKDAKGYGKKVQYKDGKEIIEYYIEFDDGICFTNEMEHLIGTYAFIDYVYPDGDIILRDFTAKGDTDWGYCKEMLEKVKNEQISFESLDELRDKMENLKPKQKAIDIQIKCLEKVCSDLEKELDDACKEFEEFKNEGIDTIKEAKIAIEKLKNTYNEVKENKDGSLK